MSQSILVVDDDPAQVRMMEMTLRGANYEPLTATDGESGLRVFAAHSPDLVILDVMMPGMDGWETCYRIRQISTVPIIFLTGRQTPDDKISGLKLGADDYLIKPFLPAELLARVESVLRRTYHPRRPIQNLLKAGPEVMINRTTREVIVRDETRPLRPGEYSLLLLLAEHAGETLSVDRIARGLGVGDEERRAERVKWHVWKLRQSIELDPRHPRIIVTEAGSGYRLELR